MQKLDSKKIDALIKQLENAGKVAIKGLNEMTEGGYKDSDIEKDPFAHLGIIGRILTQAREQAKLQTKYEGMDEDQIAAAQAAEREAEKEELQRLAQEKLAKRQVKEPDPKAEPEAEPTGDENQQ